MKPIVKCLIGIMLLLSLVACSTDTVNKKYAPWDVVSLVELEPELSNVNNVMKSNSSYWSFCYLFGVYEINNKFAGFDILYFLNFPKKRYTVNKVDFENEFSSANSTSLLNSYFSFCKSYLPFLSDFSFSRTERLKKMTLDKMCANSRFDVIMSPTYKTEGFDMFIWQDTKCNMKCFGGTLHGFKKIKNTSDND